MKGNLALKKKFWIKITIKSYNIQKLAINSLPTINFEMKEKTYQH